MRDQAMRQRWITILALTSVLAAPTSAQMVPLVQGAEIRISTGGSRPMGGRITSWTPSSVTLTRGHHT